MGVVNRGTRVMRGEVGWDILYRYMHKNII